MRLILENRKEDPSYVVAKILAKLLSTVMWKVENMFVELNDPVREIPGQNVFLPVAYSK